MTNEELLRVYRALEGIERDHGVKIVYAIEAGSRAWGSPSPDSDFDVRFIYVRRPEDYLSVVAFQDAITNQHNRSKDDLDIFGFDIIRAFRLLMEWNPFIVEWMYSVQRNIYRESDFFRLAARSCIDPVSVPAMVKAYIGMARSTIHEMRKSVESKTIKRLVYVVRPLMSAEYLLSTGEMSGGTMTHLVDWMWQQDIYSNVSGKRIAFPIGAVRDMLELKACGRGHMFERFSSVMDWALDTAERLQSVVGGLPSAESPDGKRLNRVVLDVVKDVWR